MPQGAASGACCCQARCCHCIRVRVPAQPCAAVSAELLPTFWAHPHPHPPTHSPLLNPHVQAAVVAIANIYYGMLHIYDGLGAWAWASYTAVLAVIVGISVTKDTSDFLR